MNAPASTDTPAGDHIATLDGARGLAAMAVVISHLANANMLPAVFGMGLGRMGVALFFVLSGFLMAYLYAHRGFNTQTVAGYLRSRIGRVLPLYFLIVGVSAVGMPFWTYDVTPTLAQHLVLAKGVNVLWTIPVEVQFYIVFLLIWAVPRRTVALSVLFLAGLLGAFVSLYRFGEASTLPVWLHFFLLGTVLGLAYRKSPEVFAKAADTRLGSWAGWLVLVALPLCLPQLRREWGLLGDFSPNPWVDPVASLLPIAIFLCALMRLGPFARLSSPPLRWLGSVSFAVYLIHMLFLENLRAYADPALSLANVTLAACVIGLTLIASQLSLTLFETPMQRLIAKRQKS